MTEELIIAYLLEELPEAELEQFEDACFAEESWPDQIKPVEEDLIDAYLRRELTEERRQRFEQNYLTTEARQERLLLAAALLRRVDELNASAPKAGAEVETESSTGPTLTERLRAFWNSLTWTLRTATALALVAFLACVLWLALFRESSPETFTPLALTISVNTNRGQGVEAPKVNLPLKTDALKISLKLPERVPAQTARYRIELENDLGAAKPLKINGQDAQSITVVIPAGQLARGLYALKLFAIKPDGTEQRINGGYFFAVE